MPLVGVPNGIILSVEAATDGSLGSHSATGDMKMHISRGAPEDVEKNQLHLSPFCRRKTTLGY